MKNKILVVDDETTLANAIADKFTREGYQVLTAANGQEGLDTSLKEHPDMILLDIIMPVMDGIMMLSKLRQDQWGKNAKVILLTNLSDPGNIKETLHINGTDYFVKSDWRLVDIIDQVKKKLRE